VDVSIIGVGGYHLGLANVQEQDAIRIIRHALDEGINFLDNCWDYNAGVSEERMGKALKDGYRQKAFLMTKIDGRTGAEARKQIVGGGGVRSTPVFAVGPSSPSR
jgi:predicted aldo/keto reductase-like oxidoreductase